MSQNKSRFTRFRRLLYEAERELDSIFPNEGEFKSLLVA